MTGATLYENNKERILFTLFILSFICLIILVNLSDDTLIICIEICLYFTILCLIFFFRKNIKKLCIKICSLNKNNNTSLLDDSYYTEEIYNFL